MKTIYKQATISKKNGVKQIFDAILITEKGVYTGLLNINKESKEEFKENSFIPHDQVESIKILNDSETLDIDIKKIKEKRKK